MMNGTVTTEQRLVRKRALEAELAVVRAQKTDVLRQIGQIAKKQRLGGPPPPGAHLTHDAKVDHERRYHLEEQAKVWNACSRILAEVLKNRDTKTYFGEPVHRTMYPDYYNIVKEPRDLGTIKSERRAAPRVVGGAPLAAAAAGPRLSVAAPAAQRGCRRPPAWPPPRTSKPQFPRPCAAPPSLLAPHSAPPLRPAPARRKPGVGRLPRPRVVPRRRAPLLPKLPLLQPARPLHPQLRRRRLREV
jgi:hypothetical protein